MINTIVTCRYSLPCFCDFVMMLLIKLVKTPLGVSTIEVSSVNLSSKPECITLFVYVVYCV